MPSVATAAKLSMHNKQAYEWDIQTDRQTDRQRSMLSTPSLWVDAHNKFKAIVSSPSQVTTPSKCCSRHYHQAVLFGTGLRAVMLQLGSDRRPGRQ